MDYSILVNNNNINVSTNTNTYSVSLNQVGPQGATGATGASGVSSITKLAAVALSGHRVVYADSTGKVNYADSSTLTHANIVLGITNNAGIANDPITVFVSGEIVEPSWTWVPSAPVFLGLLGNLTQSVPTTGFILIVGIAINATTLSVGIKQPIKLN